MRLHELEFSPDQAKALERLLDKVGASAGMARDSSDMMRRTFGFETRAASINEDKRSVDVIASTAALDSYDEVVEQDWRLERFRKNPVILYNHNSVGLCGPADDTLPIGYATNIRAYDNALEMTLNFVDAKANPMAEKVWQSVKQGSLRATSVGFRPGKVTKVKEGDEKEIVHLSQNELYEVSVCPVPANPEAVARSTERNHAQAQRLAEQSTETRAAIVPDEENQTMTENKKSDAEIKLEAAQGEITRLTAALTESEKTAFDAKKEAATEKARADELDAEMVERDVTALLGKKILPAQKDDFIEDRKRLGSKKFAERVARMPDLTILDRVTTEEENPTKSAASEAASGEPVAIKKRLSAVK